MPAPSTGYNRCRPAVCSRAAAVGFGSAATVRRQWEQSLAGARRRAADPAMRPAAAERQIPRYSGQPSEELANVRYRRTPTLAGQIRMAAASLLRSFDFKPERQRMAIIVNSIPGEADPAGAQSSGTSSAPGWRERRGGVNRREVTRRRPWQSADSRHALKPGLSASCSSESHSEAIVAPASSTRCGSRWGREGRRHSAVAGSVLHLVQLEAAHQREDLDTPGADGQ